MIKFVSMGKWMLLGQLVKKSLGLWCVVCFTPYSELGSSGCMILLPDVLQVLLKGSVSLRFCEVSAWNNC